MLAKPASKGIPYASLHPRYAWMRDYLAGLAIPGQLPSRRQLDPLDMRALLPFIVLLDVSGPAEAREFRYRLMGSHHIDLIGHNYTGMELRDATSPRLLARVLRNVNLVADSGQPLYDRFPLPFRGREFIDSERVYYPLAEDGQNVDVILVLNGYPDNPDLQSVLPPVRPKQR